MRTALKITIIFFLSLISLACTAKKLPETGFLSNYSNLQAVSKNSLRYRNPHNSLKNYSNFIIDPVVVRFYDKSKVQSYDPKELAKLKSYMRHAIKDAISGRYKVVEIPAPETARIRVAITDLNESTPILNVIPLAKLSGAGLGGATMEAEILDSRTNEQIAAIVESQKGKRISLHGLTKWSHAQAAMDNWASRLRERLDEAHGERQ